MNAINLIPRRARDAAVVRRRVTRWVIGGCAYSAAVAVTCAVLRLVGGQEHSRLSSDGGRLAERLAAAESALKAVRAQVQDHARRLEASETVGVHPDWSVLLSTLAEQRADDIVLQAIELKSIDPPPAAPPPSAAEGGAAAPKSKPRSQRFEAYSLHLKGFGLSQGDVVKFVRRLEDLGPLIDVRLKESRAQPYRGVLAIGFDAECRLSERRTVQAETEVAP